MTTHLSFQETGSGTNNKALQSIDGQPWQTWVRPDEGKTLSIPSQQDVGIAWLDCAPFVALVATSMHVSVNWFKLEQTSFVPGTKTASPVISSFFRTNY